MFHSWIKQRFSSAPARPAAMANSVDTTVDTRPVITVAWRNENPIEWDLLWNGRNQTCPVCLEIPDLGDGPMNSDIATRCTHWACVECWKQIARYDGRCPICRDDVGVWLECFDSDDEEMNSSDEFQESVDENEESEESSDDPLWEPDPCFVCLSADGNNRNFYNIEGGRVVCSLCYREDMGEVESFF